jgi:hypothetical protein
VGVMKQINVGKVACEDDETGQNGEGWHETVLS